MSSVPRVTDVLTESTLSSEMAATQSVQKGNQRQQ